MQFFSNAPITLFLTELYLRRKYSRYYFLLVVCREPNLITKERIVPKGLYNSYNRVDKEDKGNVVIYKNLQLHRRFYWIDRFTIAKYIEAKYRKYRKNTTKELGFIKEGGTKGMKGWAT